ncbi:flap endonuclease-1 [Lentinula aff. detonsa]|uniref:Flap endonuclease-1 n=1 Tax=Lentinula aff. detonsa TaxID=2804958 RepID=A0AA38KN99_9AGAR|nr:flap endonuclease-1 [Lentinula aff. detonsa]
MAERGLTGLILEHAPQAIKEHDIKTLFGRGVAIDASMSMLMNDAGETTSHLMGFFYRTIRIVENGIKPAYVFDGKPPELKKGVLSKCFARREEAKEEGAEAKEVGTVEDVDRFSRQTVKVTKQHNKEYLRLLQLMDIPVIVAPLEAEAQCAELARGGKPKKQPISEIDLKAALDGLNINMSQFVDLCILLGCDYLEPIKGVGPKSALKLICEHNGLKGIVKHLRAKTAEKEKATAEVKEEEEEEEKPTPTSDVEQPDGSDVEEASSGNTKSKAKKKGGKGKGKGEAKELLMKPNVTHADELELEWKNPDVDGLIQFLVTKKGFKYGAEKLLKFLNTKQQGRLDGFFTVTAKPKEAAKGKGKEDKGKKGTKRKGKDQEQGASKGKKSKTKK